VEHASPLTAELLLLNGRRAAVYDFTGTGSIPENDADPAFYEIDAATLGLLELEAGDRIRVRGHVNEFGTAPMDFNAVTVINAENNIDAASARVGWKAGTDMPFVTIAGARIDLYLTNARVTVTLDGVALDTPVTALALVAPNKPGMYAVKVRGADEIQVFRSFADLVDELTAQLDAGTLLRRITAHGGYNSATNELTIRRASFEFEDPKPTES
jgi:hypothetical protein